MPYHFYLIKEYPEIFSNLSLSVYSYKYFYNEPCGKKLCNFKYSLYQKCLFVFTDFTEIEVINESETNIAFYFMY